jgi:hypothetical protein
LYLESQITTEPGTIAVPVLELRVYLLGVSKPSRFALLERVKRDALLTGKASRLGGVIAAEGKAGTLYLQRGQPWGQPFTYDLFDVLKLSEFGHQFAERSGSPH